MTAFVPSWVSCHPHSVYLDWTFEELTLCATVAYRVVRCWETKMSPAVAPPQSDP